MNGRIIAGTGGTVVAAVEREWGIAPGEWERRMRFRAQVVRGFDAKPPKRKAAKAKHVKARKAKTVRQWRPAPVSAGDIGHALRLGLLGGEQRWR